MSNSVIGSLRVNLGLDAALFERGVAAAQTAARSLSRRLRGLGLTAAGVGAALTLAMRGQLNAADDMAKMADRMGITVEALSRLEHAASMSGVSMQTLQTGMRSLTQIAVQNAGQLHALGVATRDAAGQVRPINDIFADVADRLAAMPPGAERTALAIQLLGRQGAELIPMLQGGSSGLREMSAEADALGLTLSTRTARAAEAFNDNISRLQRQFTGIVRSIMAEVLPALVAISNGIVAAVGLFRHASEAIGGFRGFVVAAALAVTAAYVPALVSAAMATGAWVASLITLRGALIASGIGAFIVLAGTALNWLFRLKDGTGSWADAFRVLGAFVSQVFRSIQWAGNALMESLSGVWQTIRSKFFWALEGMLSGWHTFVESIASGIRGNTVLLGIFGDSFDSLAASAAESVAEMTALSGQASAAAAESFRAAAYATSTSRTLLDSAVFLLRDNMRVAEESTDGATGAVTDLNDALSEVPSTAGGARAAMETLPPALEAVSDAARQIESSFESAFVDFVTGTKSARDAIADLIRDLARLAAQAVFRRLFGMGGVLGGSGGIGGLLSGLLSFDGGGYTGNGARVGGLDGKGGQLAILHPQETVIDHTKGQSAGGGVVQVAIRVDNDGALRAFVERTSGQVVAEVAPAIVRQSVSATRSSFEEFRPA